MNVRRGVDLRERSVVSRIHGGGGVCVYVSAAVHQGVQVSGADGALCVGERKGGGGGGGGGKGVGRGKHGVNGKTRHSTAGGSTQGGGTEYTSHAHM